MRLTELRQNEVATLARALQIRGYKFDWQDVESLTVLIRGPFGVYLLLRGRWTGGSRHVLGSWVWPLMLGVWLLAGHFFCAFDDRTMITNRLIIINFPIFYFDWLLGRRHPINPHQHLATLVWVANMASIEPDPFGTDRLD